jgi:hypothetical protein
MDIMRRYSAYFYNSNSQFYPAFVFFQLIAAKTAALLPELCKLATVLDATYNTFVEIGICLPCRYYQKHLMNRFRVGADFGGNILLQPM